MEVNKRPSPDEQGSRGLEREIMGSQGKGTYLLYLTAMEGNDACVGEKQKKSCDSQWQVSFRERRGSIKY